MQDIHRKEGVVEVSLINKDAIVCYTCSREVATTVDEVNKGMEVGYALFIEDDLMKVICERCRRR